MLSLIDPTATLVMREEQGEGSEEAYGRRRRHVSFLLRRSPFRAFTDVLSSFGIASIFFAAFSSQASPHFRGLSTPFHAPTRRPEVIAHLSPPRQRLPVFRAR